ncbi:hypothetical protein ACFLVF_02450 [Chloroflexota bacterium]
MKAKAIALIIVTAVMVSLCTTVVYAQLPSIPHAFYGNITINGNPSPPGIIVEATGAGVLTDPASSNPIVTTEIGEYGSVIGSTVPSTAALLVQGNIVEGTIITFSINGVQAGQTAEWHSGQRTRLDLTVTMANPPLLQNNVVSGGGGGGGGAPNTMEELQANLFGGNFLITISESGEILQEISATSSNGEVKVKIPSGTIALYQDNPLSTLKVAVDTSPPSPPANANVIGLVYDFGPDGATFEPPMIITRSYDTDDIPDGVAEEDLVLAYYDDTAGKWVMLTSEVDTVKNIITASVAHFTSFAVLTPKPLPANSTPAKPKPAPEPKAAPASEPKAASSPAAAPTPSATPEKSQEPVPSSVPENATESSVNLPVLMGFLAAVVAVIGIGLSVALIRKRRY